MPKEFQSLVYILHFFGGVEMTDWMNLLCWYIFIIMLCDLVTNAQPYTVSSLIYITQVILVNKKYFRRSETREKKIDNIIIYIVENIKFIYTSFDEFFLPVSQRVEMNYIFSDNVRILYLSCYFKSPKETVKLSKKSRNKRCSYRFWLCPLWSPRL
jgi:hypothetical protein